MYDIALTRDLEANFFWSTFHNRPFCELATVANLRFAGIAAARGLKVEIVKTGSRSLSSRCSHRWFGGARIRELSVNAEASASITRRQARSSRQGCSQAAWSRTLRR
jgi:hypothetical protein